MSQVKTAKFLQDLSFNRRIQNCNLHQATVTISSKRPTKVSKGKQNQQKIKETQLRVEQMHKALCVPITPEKKKTIEKWGQQGMV